MPRLSRAVFTLVLCAAPGAGGSVARAQSADVQVHLDVQVPVPVLVVPAPPEPAHHHRPPADRDEPRPPPPPPSHDRDERHERDAPRARHEHGHDFHVPPDRVPGRGLCRIWFDDLPPDRQPPPMACDRAHRLARRHGGRVIWDGSGRAHQDGRVASSRYGRANFDGVPPDRLPPPGACRVWIDGVPPDRQPPPEPCGRAEHEARRVGGRVLYMPGP